MNTDTHIDEPGVVQLTQDLVRIPTVFDPDRGLNEEPAARFVEETMRSFGWDPVVDEVAPSRPNVIAVIEGGPPGPRLLFEGHTDVVTEGSREAWTVDPFGGEVIDSRLYGRGSADMKGGVAAMIHAVRAVEQTGSFPGSIVVAALVDEEGGMIGVKDFLARGHGDFIDAAIVCEPEETELCCVAKGAIRLGVNITGRMAHGAMPHKGVNPNRAIGALLARLDELEQSLDDEHGEHPLLGKIHLTPTVIEGGSRGQHNVIPDSAWVGIDIRTNPEVTHDNLLAEIDAMTTEVGEIQGVEIHTEVIEERPTAAIEETHPIARAVYEAHEEVEGEPPRFGGVPGTTDGTILLRDGGIPNVVYGPGPKWIAHQPDEYVEVEDLVKKTRVYARAALNYLGGEAS